MYTIEALVIEAGRRGVPVTARQVKEWHRQGLLPTPTRVPTGKAQGRAPYRFPPGAPGAVTWLGEWRRYCNSPDTAAFWMWMEGFDHVALDQAQWSRIVRDWLEDQELKVRRAFPHHTCDPASLTDAQRDDNYVAIDKLINQPLVDADESPAFRQVIGVTLIALCGLMAPDMAEMIEERAIADRNDGGDSMTYLEAIQMALADKFDFPHFDLDSLPGNAQPITAFFPALALPRIAASGIQWDGLQRTWRLVLTAFPYIPADIAHATRRRIYGTDPVMVVAAMMSLSAVLPLESLITMGIRRSRD